MMARPIPTRALIWCQRSAMTDRGQGVTMTTITIRMNNSAGEIDSKRLHVDGDAQDDACAALVAEALIGMIREVGVIYPGDNFTIVENER